MNANITPIYTANKLLQLESYSKADFNKLSIIWDENPENGKLGYFKAFSNSGDLWVYINNFPPDKRTFHEVIFNKDPQRIRFDIDVKDEKKVFIDNYDISKLGINSNISNHNAIIQYIRDIIYEKFIDCYGKYIKEDLPGKVLDKSYKDSIMMITESHNEDKYSYHIIITKHKLKNSAEVSLFVDKVIKILEEKDKNLADLIDRQIYNGHTKNFRLLTCCKANDTSRIKTISKTNMNIVKNLDKGMIQSSYDRDHIIDFTYCEDVEMICKSDNTSSIITKVQEEHCKKVLAKKFPDYKYSSTKSNILIYTRKYPSKCKICCRHHTQENAYGWINNNILWWNCRRNTDTSKWLQIEVLEENKFDMFNYLSMIKDEITNTNCEELDPLKKYKEKYDFKEYARKEIDKFPTQYDTLYVKAPMKLGKTKSLISHLRTDEIKQNIKSICFISFRRTFTDEFLPKFNGPRGLNKLYKGDLKDYRYIDGNITADANPFVMVQVDSFHRIRSKYDMVILDESESIYDQFSSSKIDQLSMIVTNFSKVIKNAKKVILMDAYMTDITVELTNMIRGEKKSDIKFEINKFKNQGLRSDKGQYNYNIGYDENNFYSKIQKALRLGKKIVFMSNTRDKLKAYEKLISREFPHLNIQSYTALSDREDRKDLEDVNKYWLQYDIIMYSPTITAGISFEESHFDELFCSFSNMSCSVLSCIQMIGRVRDVKDKEITVLLENYYCRCSITKQNIEQDLVDGRNELLSLTFKGSSIIDDDDNEEEDIFKYIPHKDTYYHIWLHNQLGNNISKKFFAKYLIYCIHTTGAKITLYNKLEGNGRELRKEAQKEVVNERYQGIADVPLPTSEEVRNLWAKREITNLTEKEEYSLQKVKIKQDYGIKNNHVLYKYDFIETYFPPAIRYIWGNLNEILVHYETLGEAIEEIAYYESNQIKRFVTELDTRADLNTLIKTVIHQSCKNILEMCGFKHILTNERFYTEVSKEKMKKLLLNRLSFIQKELKRHNLRPAKLSKDKKSKELHIDEQYFNMKLDGINRILKKIYGVEIVCDNDIFKIDHKFNFLIVDSYLAMNYISDDRPYIWYKGFKKPKDIHIKKYKHEGLIENENDNEDYSIVNNFDFDRTYDTSDNESI